jgi:hypothetical protein
MSVLDDLISGSGDRPDLRPVEVIYLKGTETVINDETGIPINTGLLPYETGEFRDRRPVIDLHIEPGYFYHEREEFYLYSRKGTLIGTTRTIHQYNVTGVYPETGIQEVILKGIIPFPSGVNPHGYSRIGLSGPYETGEFSNFYLQYINETGLISGYLNDPEIESGAYPRRYNPFNPLALCYSGWDTNNEDKIIRPDKYFYHAGLNAVQYEEAEDNELYIVEYEASTLPAITGINMSPLNIPTRTGFIVISPDDHVYPLESVRVLEVTERSVDKRFVISIEVLDTHNNLAGLRDIKVKIRQIFSLLTGEEFVPEIVQINEYYTVYRIPFSISDFTDIFMNGEKIITLAPGQNTFIIPTDATFYSPDKANLETTVKTDINGTANIIINSGGVPNNERSIIIDFFNNLNKLIHSITISNRNKNDGPTAIVPDRENLAIRIAEIDRSVYGKAYVSVSGIKNPQTITMYTPMELLMYLSYGGLKPRKPILSINIKNDNIVMEIDSPEYDGKFIIVETIESSENYIKLNSSVVYGL